MKKAPDNVFAKGWAQFKRFWHYVWHGNDVWSWLLSLVIAFIIIKFIFYPALGFVLNTDYPVVAIVSGSMEHKIVENGLSSPVLCGRTYEDEKRVNVDEFWSACGDFYEELGIEKSEFKEFPYSNGMNTGDIIVLHHPGIENIEVGDIIVFKHNDRSIQGPIIHRVVKKEISSSSRSGDEIYAFQTKGDHNAKSGPVEFNVNEDQIIGKALLRVPFLGYVKIWSYSLFQLIT